MASPILVTGGTGTLGRHLVPLLQESGRDIRVLSRKAHAPGDGVEYVTGDLRKDEGIGPAVEGAEIIVHCAGSARGDDEATRNLVREAAQAGAKHLVFISVAGADRVPVESRMDRQAFGYFAFKLAAERIIADSGVPWTTLRATQFHESLLKVVQGMTKLPVIPAPAAQFQPIEAGEVAARLTELALGTPAGRVPDMAGPRAYWLADLVRAYLRATGKHRPLMTLKFPGKAARAVREGATLVPGCAVGRSWEDFLAGQAGPAGGGKPAAA